MIKKYSTISEIVRALQFKDMNISEIVDFIKCDLKQIVFANNEPNLVVELDGKLHTIPNKSWLVVDSANNLTIYTDSVFEKKFVEFVETV
jgi:hypothetical protein